jgi:hypothetical protein
MPSYCHDGPTKIKREAERGVISHVVATTQDYPCHEVLAEHGDYATSRTTRTWSAFGWQFLRDSDGMQANVSQAKLG